MCVAPRKPSPQINPRNPRGIARGFTIIELMISMVIMLIVAVATVQIAANVFQSNTQSIHMIQLSQEMRSTIQLISRDIRRAGYNDDALAGFLSTQAIGSGVTMGSVNPYGDIDCLQVQYDELDGSARNTVYRARSYAISNGVVSSEVSAVFDSSEVGAISAHFSDTTTCASSLTDSGWINISDPLLTDVAGLGFILNDQLTDIAENMSNGNTIQVGVEEVNITISASLRSNNAVTRSITNEVQIRNQYLRV